MSKDALSEPVRLAFITVGFHLLGMGDRADLFRILRHNPIPEGWRELVYAITAVYAGKDDRTERRTWLERTTQARDLLTGLWVNGPKDYVPDDLEVAAAIQFLSEELKWPERK